MAEDIILCNKSDLVSVADAIREKNGTSDELTFPNGFIEGIGTMIGGEALKAFDALPTLDVGQSATLLKKVVAIPNNELISYNYTNSAESITCDITNVELGDTILAIGAFRHMRSDFALPSGWEMITLIDPAEAESEGTYQTVFVAKHIITEADLSSYSITLNVTNAQRNYLMIINLGDGDVNKDSIVSKRYTSPTSGKIFDIGLFEHSLVICSTVSTISGSTAWVVQNEVSSVIYRPNYADGNNAGGARLGVHYVPYLSEQPADNLQLTVNAAKSSSDGVIICAIEIIPGTGSYYATRKSSELELRVYE